MAKQKGIIKLKGTLGDITFYKSQDGFLAREKGGVDGDRIATDPKFARTRENGAEFGTAGKAGKVLRTSIRALLQNIGDNRLVGRLTQQMVKVLQADKTNPRGQRTVTDGDIGFLEDFDFNRNSKLTTTLFAPFTATIDRVAGSLVVEVAKFIPLNMVAAPNGTTHFKLVSAGIEVDFSAGSFVVDSQESDEIAWDVNTTAVITLTNTVTANSTHPLFLVFGIEFLQEVNGVKYPLRNGAFNALAIVTVSGV